MISAKIKNDLIKIKNTKTKTEKEYVDLKKILQELKTKTDNKNVLKLLDFYIERSEEKCLTKKN